MIAQLIVLVLLPTGGWLLYVLLRRIYRREQINQHGILADARVVDVYAVPARGGARMVAIYEYLDQQGGPHKGKSPELYDDPDAGPIPGSRCKIRFDADHPERSVWVAEAHSSSI